MLSIFPEAADFIPSGSSNGRKIRSGNANFLGSAVGRYRAAI
jgi:hypothetical protein